MKNLFCISEIISLVLFIQACKDKPTPTLPVLSTNKVTSISYTTATCGGEVTNDGGDTIMSRGICWNTATDPTLVDSKTIESGGLGVFMGNLTGLTPNTIYYIKAYATNSIGTGYGDQVSFNTLQVATPILITTIVTSITNTTAGTGGNISAENGSHVFERGVCWSILQNPTTSDSKTSDSSGIGSFKSTLTKLTGNTTYYVRAYSTNSAGTSYGNEISFTTIPYGIVSDNQGNTYKTIQIGTQVWMKENLKTTKYGNGDTIGTTTPSSKDIRLETTPKYQWAYKGNESYVTAYGRLYTWYAVTDSRNVCPTGWHVPTFDDFLILDYYLTNNGYSYESGRNNIAKSMASTSGWFTYTTPGTVGNDQASNNSSGFTALPAGYRGPDNYSFPFGEMLNAACWWSSTEVGASNAYNMRMYYTVDWVAISEYGKKTNGYSVRCLKD